MTVEKQWEDLLTPAVMQERLISVSLYITAFEMLKDSIVGRLKDFYCIGFTQDGVTTSPDYKNKVLSLNKSPTYASLAWLQHAQVIDQDDIVVFERVKDLRNTLAHELPAIVMAGREIALTEGMQDVLDLMRKIEIWWINADIEINPDFDGHEVNPDDIVPGPLLMIEIMLQVLSGNEDIKKSYMRE